MENAYKILVVEDDKYISHFLKMSLKNEGYEILIAQSANEGMFLFSSNSVDIVLLDLGLPDRDGLTVIDDIRAVSSVPILVVSARGQEKEKIAALDAGADDYITKPFHMGELLARIRVAQRKVQTTGSAVQETVLTYQELTIDISKHCVTISGEEVHLTPIEYKLLLLLLANRGKVLTHNYIMKQVWGYESYADNKTIRVFMANLRRKIEQDSTNPKFIFTEIGVGYRFADF